MTADETNRHIEWLREGDRVDDLLAAVDAKPADSGRP
jgi:hypothetical protein